MSEDTDVNSEVAEQESTVAESSSAETNTPEVADSLLETLSSDDDSSVIQKEETVSPETQDESNQVTPEESTAEETTPEEQPLGKADERKQQLNTEIRGLVEQRKALREEVERLNLETYAPQTSEELIEQGMSEDNARVTALEQKLELSEYNNRVVEAQLALGEQSQKVLADFPMFDPDSTEYDSEIAEQAAESLDAALIRDPNTKQIIGSHLTPYQIYKPIADAFKKSQIQGQIKGQKANRQMLANADAPSSASPRAPKTDPLLDILSSDD